MNALRSFLRLLRLPGSTKRLAVEAALFLFIARVLVLCVPLGRWRHLLGAVEEPGKTGAESIAAEDPPVLGRKLGRVVRKVAPHMPFNALCLPQAITGQWMLRRRGSSSRLIIGVRRSAVDAQGRDLDLHAWLMVAGQCVIGKARGAPYVPLLAFRSAPGVRKGTHRAEVAEAPPLPAPPAGAVVSGRGLPRER